MSNFVLNRLHKTKVQPVIQSSNNIIQNDEENLKVPASPIVPPDVLRAELEKGLNPTPKTMTTEDRSYLFELVHFSCLFEFVNWYEANKDVFSEAQQKPLSSLIDARNLTIGGCNCDLEKRKFIAEDYFRKFWVNNRTTDLLPTLLSALKTKKVIFGDFLSYPEQ